MFDNSKIDTSTAAACEAANLFGGKPEAGEVDRRPEPEMNELSLCVGQFSNDIAAILADTCFEEEAANLLSGLCYWMDRNTKQTASAFDRNKVQRDQLVREQDGSEVKSNQLEALQIEAEKLDKLEELFGSLRETLEASFQAITGKIWLPATRRAKQSFGQTSAAPDSKTFNRQRDAQKAERNKIDGPLVLFSGGYKWGANQDEIELIHKHLDKAKANHPEMILGHTGMNKGADVIAAAWAQRNKVTAVAFRPKSMKGKAGFDRNREMAAQETVVGVLIYEGTGIQSSLADECRKKRIPTKIVLQSKATV